MHRSAEGGRQTRGIGRAGRREGDALYDDEELDALALLTSYVALAVQNHALAQTLSATCF